MISKLLKGLGDKKDSKGSKEPVSTAAPPQESSEASAHPHHTTTTSPAEKGASSPSHHHHGDKGSTSPSGVTTTEGGSSPVIGRSSSGTANDATSSQEPERFQSRGSGRVERGGNIFPTTSGSSSDNDNQRRSGSSGRFKSPPLGGGASIGRSISPNRDSPLLRTTSPKSDHRGSPQAIDGSPVGLNSSGFRQARVFSTTSGGAVGFSQDRSKRPASPQPHSTSSGCPFGGDDDVLGGSTGGGGNNSARGPPPIPVSGTAEVSFRSFADNIGALSARFYALHPEERLDDMENSEDVVKLRKLHAPPHPILPQQQQRGKTHVCDHNGNTAISNIFSATATTTSTTSKVAEVLSAKGYSTINSNAWKRPFEDDDNTLTSISPLPRSVLKTPPLVPNANIEALLGTDWTNAQPPSTSPSNDHSPDGGGDDDGDSSEGSSQKRSGSSDRPFGGMQDTINDLTARMEHEMINPEDITGGVAELYHTAFLRQPLSAYCTKKFKKLMMGRLPSGGMSPFRGGAHNPHRRTLSTNSATRGFRPSPRNHDQMATSNKVVELPGVAEQLQSTPEAFVFHQHYRHRVAGQSGTTSTGRTPHGGGLAPSNGHPSRSSFSSLRGSTRQARDIFTLSMNLSPPCTPRTDEAGCGLRQLTPAEFADIEAVGDVLSGVYERGPEAPSSDSDSCDGDDDGDMVEGLLATGGANPSRLSASFSLAPTTYTTPADMDEQIPGKPASPAESSPTPSPTNSDDAAPPSPSEGCHNNAAGGDSASAVPLLTCLDIVTSNGTMLCVMGDAQGRIELLEGPEGPDWEERGPPSQRIISRKHQLDAHTQQQQQCMLNQVSPTVEYAYPPDFSTDELSPRSFVTTPCTETTTSAAAPPPANVPPLRHDEAAALAGGHSSIGVPMFRTSSPNRGPQRSSVFKAREPSFATQCGNFSRRCQHQAFVNEFDCLKSVVIDQQLRCVKFLPPNRAQGVTSYLAANEKTIKLFRIKSDQYQQSSVWEPPGGALSGSTLLSSNASGTFSSPPTTTSTSTSNANNKKRRQSLRGSVGSLSTNRLHRRIVMPVKAFTNVHQYPIQSISLSADGETFLSMDDFRVYWWHLDASDTTKATLLCDIKPPGNNEIDTLLTAASFHHTHSSLFLCAQSDGVCNVGDLRDPPCRGKSRKYPVSFKINPELHNAVNHPYHDDILSAISAASFLGHNYVVTRDYMTLKLWDLRNSACPAATCPVMGYLGSTIDFLYDSDYIFDRFPLAVDNASMSVVTGMYDGTVAVWRPGRGLYRNSSLPGADNEYHDPTATSSPFGFGRNAAGRVPPNASSNSANYKFISSSGGVVAAYDEVEFYAAQQPLGSNDPLNSKGKDKDILSVVQKQIREARLKKRRGGGVGNNSNLNSTTNTNQGYTHQRTLSRNSSMEGSTVCTTGPCTGSFHESDTALEGSDDGSHASSTYSGDLDDLEDELEPYGQAGDITDMWDVSDDGLGTAYVPKAHKTHISLSLLKARSVVMSAEEDEELLYKREKNRRLEEARVRRRQEILKSQQAAAMGGSSSSDDEARGESTSGMRRTGNMTGMDALDDESRGGHDTTTATTHEEDTPTVYPRNATITYIPPLLRFWKYAPYQHTTISILLLIIAVVIGTTTTTASAAITTVNYGTFISEYTLIEYTDTYINSTASCLAYGDGWDIAGVYNDEANTALATVATGASSYVTFIGSYCFGMDAAYGGFSFVYVWTGGRFKGKVISRKLGTSMTNASYARWNTGQPDAYKCPSNPTRSQHATRLQPNSLWDNVFPELCSPNTYTSGTLCERSACVKVEDCVEANTISVSGTYFPNCVCTCKTGFHGPRCQVNSTVVVSGGREFATWCDSDYLNASVANERCAAKGEGWALASLTSQPIDYAVTWLTQENFWIGGTHNLVSGKFEWQYGRFAGKAFSSGLGTPVVEPGMYVGFSSGEPSQANCSEGVPLEKDVMVWEAVRPARGWNDLWANGCGMQQQYSVRCYACERSICLMSDCPVGTARVRGYFPACRCETPSVTFTLSSTVEKTATAATESNSLLLTTSLLQTETITVPQTHTATVLSTSTVSGTASVSSSVSIPATNTLTLKATSSPTHTESVASTTSVTLPLTPTAPDTMTTPHTPTISLVDTPSVTAPHTLSVTLATSTSQTHSLEASLTASLQPTPTPTYPLTTTHVMTGTATAQPTSSPTQTPTHIPTSTESAQATPTHTSTSSITNPPTPSTTATPSPQPTPSPTATSTILPFYSATPTTSNPPTHTPTHAPNSTAVAHLLASLPLFPDVDVIESVVLAGATLSFDHSTAAPSLVNLLAGSMVVPIVATEAALGPDAITGNPNGFYLQRPSVAVTIDNGNTVKVVLSAISGYAITQDEQLHIYTSLFAIMGSDAALVGSVSNPHKLLLLGTVVARSESDGTGSPEIIASVVTAGGGVTGGMAAELQAVGALAMMGCADPNTKSTFGSYRVLSPVAVMESYVGVIIGNAVLAGAVGVFQLVVLLILRICKRVGRTVDLMATARFPSLFLGAALMFHTGTVYSSSQLVSRASEFEVWEVVIGAAGMAYSITLPVVLIVHPYLRIDRAYQEYAIDEWLAGRKLPAWTVHIVPRGAIFSTEIRRAFGSYVSAFRSDAKEVWWTSMPVWTGSVVGIGGLFHPTTVPQCQALFVSMGLIMLALAAVVIWRVPLRSDMGSWLDAASRACLGAIMLCMAAALVDMDVASSSASAAVFIASLIQIALVIVRVAHRILCWYVDSRMATELVLLETVWTHIPGRSRKVTRQFMTDDSEALLEITKVAEDRDDVEERGGDDKGDSLSDSKLLITPEISQEDDDTKPAALQKSEEVSASVTTSPLSETSSLDLSTSSSNISSGTASVVFSSASEGSQLTDHSSSSLASETSDDDDLL